MAYGGYLIKVGSSELPLKYIQYQTYSITPNQRMDLEAERDATGVLHRTTVEHQATKIEFDTPYLTNSEISALNSLIQSAWSDSASRTLSVSYYDPETDGYKTATCYMPDVSFTIYNIDTAKNKVLYAPVRYAFIEY